MSSDEDADELAELRAQRAARLGGASGLAALREQQRRAEKAAAAASQFHEGGPSKSSREEDEGEASRNVGMPPPRVQERFDHDSEDEDGPVVVEMSDKTELEAQQEEQLRFQLPLAFGLQEKKVSRPDELHGKFKRPAPVPAPAVGPPRPPSFGPPRPPAAAKSTPDEDLVGPPRPDADAPADGDPQGFDDDAGGEDAEADDPWLLPVSHEVCLGGHTRAVTALDIDHTGSRMITGGLDYMVRIYDFNGMKSDMRSFRELEPQEGHPVHALSWSPTGDAFLVVTGSSKAKIYDRDGISRGEFVRGDMYIRDMKNTKGHVSGLCSGQWHPTDRFTAMTCSEDGTVRIWDTWNILQKTVIKPTLTKPVRTSVTSCRYSSDGRLIGAGLMDGSIQVWSVTGKFGSSAAVGQVLPPSPQHVEKQGWSYVSRPTQVVRSAHRQGEDITGLCFSRDGHTLLSRGMDATMKLWDLRKFTQPVRTFHDLPCAHSNTMCIFSPDEQLVLTGINTGKPQDETGALVIFDKAKGELVRQLGMPGTVTALAWQPRLNQIFVTTGTRKVGSTRVLYDTTFSERGVMTAAARIPRKPDPSDYQPPLLVKEYDPTRKRRRNDPEVDPSKLRCPDLGMLAGVGRQGRIGTSTKTLLTQHIMKTKGKLTHVDETQDPREALLRQEGKEDVFSLFTDAYKDTQPERIFAEEEPEEET